MRKHPGAQYRHHYYHGHRRNSAKQFPPARCRLRTAPDGGANENYQAENFNYDLRDRDIGRAQNQESHRGQETHGAQAGGGVAGYLKEGVDDEAEVLDSLASAGKEAAAPSESKDSAAKPPDDDSIDRDLLDKLTKSKK